MDKFQKYNSFNRNTPSSESYRNCGMFKMFGIMTTPELGIRCVALCTIETSKLS